MSKQSVLYAHAQPAPVVVLSGKEDALADRAFDEIRKRLKQQFAQLELHDCQADTAASGELATLVSPSLFGEPRLIRVSGIEQASAEFGREFAQVVQLLDDATFLVLRHRDLVKAKALINAAKQVPGAVEVNCQELKKPAEKFEVLNLEARRLGVQLDRDAAQLLVQAFSSDVAELFAVLGQLAVQSSGKITAQAVQSITAGRVETTAFAVVDAALLGNTAQALTLLRHAVATGVELIPMLGAIGKSVRDMARVAGAGNSVGQLANELGMPPWMLEKAARNAAKYSEFALAQLVQQVAATDMALKGDARDPLYALEKLVLQIAARGR